MTTGTAGNTSMECCWMWYMQILNIYIEILLTKDDSIPMNIWVRRLEQATTISNLLWLLWWNLELSSHTEMEGQVEYYITTLSPPGNKVIIHGIIKKGVPWKPHAVGSWLTLTGVGSLHTMECIYDRNLGKAYPRHFIPPPPPPNKKVLIHIFGIKENMDDIVDNRFIEVYLFWTNPCVPISRS